MHTESTNILVQQSNNMRHALRIYKPRRRLSFRERIVRLLGINEYGNIPYRFALPKWFCSSGAICYFLALLAVNMLFLDFSLPWYYILFGSVGVLVFFAYGRSLSRNLKLSRFTEQRFEHRIFGIAFFFRITWMILIYFIFMDIYGNPIGFSGPDARDYYEMGVFVANTLENGNFNLLEAIHARFHFDASDSGYGIYCGFVYLITGKSFIALHIIKCFWSALTVVLIYRIAKPNFGENVAHVAAIFCTLWPNFWYYSGCHLKETEMVFLGVLFVYEGEKLIRSRRFTLQKIIPMLLIIGALFTIRVPLALVAILSLLFTIVMSSTKVMGWGKRITVGAIAIALVAVTMGERIEENSRQLMEVYNSDHYQSAYERGSTAKGGNTFSRYVGAAVFAPMILTIPFPTMTNVEGHYVHQLLNGGNFIKNIVSFFTILAVIILLLSGEWHKHLMSLSFMLGYLAVVALSNYAQAERFHQPAMPFEFMFAAYGLSIVLTNRKYKSLFRAWCVAMIFAAIAMNWIKLAGKGFV